MRNRFPFPRKTLALLGSAIGFGFLLNFYFDDGAMAHRFPHLEAVAEATEADNTELDTPQTMSAPSGNGLPQITLPSGYTPTWTVQRLDGGAIRLHVLKTPFTLSQTEHRLGSEYFDYAASLFEQAGQQVHSKPLADKLEQLSLQAQNLGYSIRQAGNWGYDGPATYQLQHLQTRSAILAALNAIHTESVTNLEYNQHRRLMSRNQPGALPQAGPDLAAFLATRQSILSDPAAQQTPETLRIIQKESALLHALAMHTTLHWESTLYCKGSSCEPMATRFRVYVEQTLPETQI